MKYDEAGGNDCQNYRGTVATAGGRTFQRHHRIHSTEVRLTVINRSDLLLCGGCARLDTCFGCCFCGGSGGSELKTAGQASPHQLLRLFYLADLLFVVLRDFNVLQSGLQLKVARISGY